MARIQVTPPSTSHAIASNQVQNHSGGYGWTVSPMDQLRRFLVLGVQGGSRYVTEQQLTQTNAAAVQQLLQLDGVALVNEIQLFAEQNRAPKKEPSLFALAMSATQGSLETKQAAYRAMSTVCRTPTDLFSFIDYCQSLAQPKTGWGRARRTAVANWYNSKSIKDLVYHVTKYKQRNGWSNRDLLRLAHVKPVDKEHDLVYRLIAKGSVEFSDADLTSAEAKTAFERLLACEEIHTLDPKSSDGLLKAVELIHRHELVHEHVPTEFQAKPEIWEALLPRMPLNALIRNLGRLTHLGLLGANSAATQLVQQKFSDEEGIRRARVHPFNVLTALKQYANGGEGGKGKLRWTPNQQVIDLLDWVYYAAFSAVEPAGKRYLLGVDVSHSMTAKVTGSEVLGCHEAAAALGMVVLKTEGASLVMGFDHGIRDLGVSRNDRLDTVIQKTSCLNGGGTDCSLPMTYALVNKIPVDVFCVITDSETNPGRMPPTLALKQYREQMGIDARLIVFALVASRTTIADPNDRGMLDLVGFDSTTPRIVRDFSLGRF